MLLEHRLPFFELFYSPPSPYSTKKLYLCFRIETQHIMGRFINPFTDFGFKFLFGREVEKELLIDFLNDLDECETDFERWIYILKHMDTLDRMPFKARKAVFERLEKMASKANMSQEERAQYEEEWKVYNDYYNTLDFAKQEGRQEGRQEGLQEGREEGIQEGIQKGLVITARKLKAIGMTNDFIAETTGLSKEEIEKL